MVVALFYAPLAYGCTRPEMLPPLYVLLAAGFVTGMISFVLDGRLSDLPKLALVCIGGVLVQGWWLTWQPVYPSTISQGISDSLVDTTMENIQRLSLNSMLLTTACLAAFVVLCGLLTQPFLRRFILLAAAGSGVLICLIGDTLKLSGEPLMRFFWDPLDVYWNDFAFYRYQGNAGAFINLTWPLILVFTRRAYTPTNRMSRKIFWSVAALAAGSALFLNSSKSALIIGLFILPWPFLTRLLRLQTRTLVFIGVLTAIVVGAALYASTHAVIDSAFTRLSNTNEVAQSAGGRVGAYKQFINAVPQVGLVGLGPGLFQLAFPYQISPLGNTSVGLREYAHEDYLQTTLEWGWFGTFWWTLFVGGRPLPRVQELREEGAIHEQDGTPSPARGHSWRARNVDGKHDRFPAANRIDTPLLPRAAGALLGLAAVADSSPGRLHCRCAVTACPSRPSWRRSSRLPPALFDLDHVAGHDLEGRNVRRIGHRAGLDLDDCRPCP